jgi:hypothetical protein
LDRGEGDRAGFESSSGVGQSGWEGEEESAQHRYFYAIPQNPSEPGVRSEFICPSFFVFPFFFFHLCFVCFCLDNAIVGKENNKCNTPDID